MAIAAGLSCARVVLVTPFRASIGEFWRGADEYPVGVYLTPSVGFGLALAVCLPLADASSHRGSGVTGR